MQTNSIPSRVTRHSLGRVNGTHVLGLWAYLTAAMLSTYERPNSYTWFSRYAYHVVVEIDARVIYTKFVTRKFAQIIRGNNCLSMYESSNMDTSTQESRSTFECYRCGVHASVCPCADSLRAYYSIVPDETYSIFMIMIMSVYMADFIFQSNVIAEPNANAFRLTLNAYFYLLNIFRFFFFFLSILLQ